MCYNKDCKIKITSFIDGEKSTVSTEGKLINTSPELRVEYLLDSDQCSLTANGNEIVQTRRGRQNVSITFREGEQTECVLGFNGFSGTIPVFTENFEISILRIHNRYETSYIYTISIRYTLGEQKIELTITVENKPISIIKNREKR